jgi:hypothetical protein
VLVLSEALKSNTSLLSLNLTSMDFLSVVISFSLASVNGITSEGAIKLSEALKSNSSLTSLCLACNSFVASFHSHEIQIIILLVKECKNYLKHSKSTHPLIHSISAVIRLLLHFILTQCKGNVFGPEGGIKICEALESNSSLTDLNISSNSLVASFHSHSIQLILLVVKVLSNYLKHSNQTPLSLHSISTVTNLLIHIILTQHSE